MDDGDDKVLLDAEDIEDGLGGVHREAHPAAVHRREVVVRERRGVVVLVLLRRRDEDLAHLVAEHAGDVGFGLLVHLVLRAKVGGLDHLQDVERASRGARKTKP